MFDIGCISSYPRKMYQRQYSWSLLQLGIVIDKDPEYWQDAIIMEDRLGRTIEVKVTKTTTTKGSFVVGSGPQGEGSVAAYPIQQPSARN